VSVVYTHVRYVSSNLESSQAKLLFIVSKRLVYYRNTDTGLTAASYAIQRLLIIPWVQSWGTMLRASSCSPKQAFVLLRAFNAEGLALQLPPSLPNSLQTSHTGIIKDF